MQPRIASPRVQRRTRSSSRQTVRSWAPSPARPKHPAWTSNAAAVLDAIGADAFLTLGWSAGDTWLSERIPGAIAHLNPGQGHLSLGVAQVAQIVGDLVAVASAAGSGSLERAVR